MYHPRYAMFFDMHTQEGCPVVGKNFDAGKFAEKLENAGVDLVGFHAKCNQGFCYYDTAIGCRHPSVPAGRDIFGEVVEACTQKKIKVTAYFNCGLSNEDAIRHPDWCRIGMNGELLHPEIFKIGWVSPYIRTLCPNSPWRDYLFKMISEVREKYQVAGFLFDSFNAFPCTCPHCTAKMKELGMDYTDRADVIAFARKSVLQLAQDISNLLSPQENGLLCYFLGISPKDNAKLGSYLECECLPTNPAWGYDLLPLTARYFRNLKEDCPVLNMTGRFNDWGDFGSLRPEAAIEYDLFFGLANGMRPNIGDHLHPRGDLFDCVFDRVGKVYKKLQQYETWFEDARPLTELAVVSPGGVDKTPELVGMTRMLSELRIQFDFIDENCDWSKYSLLILPDTVTLTEDIAALVKKHLDSGKKIIATGKSGLNPSEDAFVFEDAWGVKHQGKCECNPAYFKLEGRFASELPDMPLAAGMSGEKVAALEKSEIAGFVYSSWYNKHWDGKYSYFYTPPAEKTGIPFLVLSEQCAYCAFPLAQAYYTQAAPDLRKVMALMIRHFVPESLISADKYLPTFARVFVSEKTDCRIVHLLNYLPELRGMSLMVEDVLPLTGVGVSLRLDGKKIRKLYLAPEKKEIPYTISGDRVNFTVPESYGYAMIVAEMQ